MDFAERWPGTEQMDEPDVPVDAMARTLHEIDRINAWLGGWSASRSLLAGRLAGRGPVRLLDVGGGSGATGRHLTEWARRRGVDLRVTTIDRHAAVCRIARAASGPSPAAHVARADAFRLPFSKDAFDFAHASLFLHHFAHDDIVAILREMCRVARVGAVVNDLERHPVAYHAIRWLTRVFAKSPLVRHDAPVSVLRGFRARDLDAWRAACGLSRLGFRRRFPFRLVAWVFADGGTPEGAA